MQLLIDREIVEKETARKLMKSKKERNRKGRKITLIQLLVQKNILSRKNAAKIRKRVSSNRQNKLRENKQDEENDTDTNKSTKNNKNHGGIRRRRRGSHNKRSPRRKSSRKKRRRPSSDKSSSTSSGATNYPSFRSRSNRRSGYNRRSRRRDQLNKITNQIARDEEDPEEPVPGYVVKNLIAKGGEGVVFHAVDKKEGDEYALKVLFPQFADQDVIVNRFLREGRYMRKLDHEHLLNGFHYGQYQDIHYQVLELIDGVTGLEAIRRKGTLPESDALDIIAQCAMALQYLKQQNLIHRDIKPGNIMIREDGQVKLFDLGFAKKIGSDPDLEEGLTMGTVEYMSPELAQDKDDIDIRSDMYALGISLYQFLTGKLPFRGDNQRELLARQVEEPLSNEKFEGFDISGRTKHFIQKLTEKKPFRRYQTPLQVVKEIKGLISSL